MGVEIKGLKELQAKFAKLDEDLQTEVDAELTASAVNITSNAKRMAPIDTGRLRGSIVPDTNTKFFKKVTANVFYAPYVEFGTGTKVQVPAGLETYAMQFKKSVKPWNGMNAQPYFFPALDAEAPKLINNLKKILEIK